MTEEEKCARDSLTVSVYGSTSLAHTSSVPTKLKERDFIQIESLFNITKSQLFKCPPDLLSIINQLAASTDFLQICLSDTHEFSY